MNIPFLRWLTSQKRHKVIVHEVSQEVLDITVERILLQLIRDEAPVDDYWFIADTGWHITRTTQA